MSSVDDVLELAKEIFTLETVLEQKRKLLRQVLGGEAAVVPVDLHRSNISSRIRDILNGTPGDSYNADQLQRLVGARSLNSVRTILCRMVANREIARERLGFYRAAKTEPRQE